MENKMRNWFRLDLQEFGGEGDKGGQVDPPEEVDDTKDPENAEERKKDEKTFTQEELDDLITARLAREKKKFSDYDEMKEKLAEFERAEKEREQAEMSELERLQAQLDEKDANEEKLTEQLEDLRKKRENDRINNEFTRLASEANIKYLDAAVKLADLSSAKVDDEGNIDGVKDIVDKLVEENPFLVKKVEQPKHIGGGTGHKEKDDKTKEQLLAEAEEKARNSGRVEDRVAFAQLRRELD